MSHTGEQQPWPRCPKQTCWRSLVLAHHGRFLNQKNTLPPNNQGRRQVVLARLLLRKKKKPVKKLDSLSTD